MDVQSVLFPAESVNYVFQTAAAFCIWFVSAVFCTFLMLFLLAVRFGYDKVRFKKTNVARTGRIKAPLRCVRHFAELNVFLACLESPPSAIQLS